MDNSIPKRDNECAAIYANHWKGKHCCPQLALPKAITRHSKIKPPAPALLAYPLLKVPASGRVKGLIHERIGVVIIYLAFHWRSDRE